MISEERIQQAAAASVKAVDDKGSYKPWAEENGLYLPQETLITWIQSNHEGVLVVDVQDDGDHVGRSVRGAIIHCSDTYLRNANILAIATQVLSLSPKTTTVFHCMESVRRGPCSAKRMQLLFDNLGLRQRDEAPTIKIRADQWIRNFWKSQNSWRYMMMLIGNSSYTNKRHKTARRKDTETMSVQTTVYQTPETNDQGVNNTKVSHLVCSNVQ